MEHTFADVCSVGLIVYRFSIPHCHCGETGSIPVGTAIIWPVSQEVKAMPFHGIIVGSSPIQASISPDPGSGKPAELEWFDSIMVPVDYREFP